MVDNDYDAVAEDMSRHKEQILRSCLYIDSLSNSVRYCVSIPGKDNEWYITIRDFEVDTYLYFHNGGGFTKYASKDSGRLFVC